MKKIILVLLLLISVYFLYPAKKLNEVEYYAYYLGETEASQMPLKTSNYVFDFGECTNGATVSFNKESWSPIINNITTARTKCSLHFKQMYKDGSGAEPPEIYEGMIPIKFTGSTMAVADTKVDAWYNYNNHEWANAALIDYSNETIKNKYFDGSGNIKPGTTIDINDLLQMYVWIPRYKYQLWNAEFGVSEPQAINITFESTDAPKSSGSTNGSWLTHPAFTFGDTELNGIWFGKFEMTGTASKPTILPNKESLTNMNMKDMFYSLQNMPQNIYGIDKNKIDTRVIRNFDWGAVAYLTSSIYGRYNTNKTCIASGCVPWKNNINTGYGDLTPLSSDQPEYGPGITGCGARTFGEGQIANRNSCVENYDWITGGIHASTTDNIYGVYDMDGGVCEISMGVILNEDDVTINYGGSNFDESTMPEKKYYTTYSYSDKGTIDDMNDVKKYNLGEATREVMRALGTGNNSWHNGWQGPVWSNATWTSRGNYYYTDIRNGLFTWTRTNGDAYGYGSFRAVLSKA